MIRICVLYCPAARGKWKTWVRADMVMGDMNYTGDALDRSLRALPTSEERQLFSGLLTVLGDDGEELIDIWRRRNPGVVAYAHTNPHRGSTRINRIYLLWGHGLSWTSGCLGVGGGEI